MYVLLSFSSEYKPLGQETSMLYSWQEKILLNGKDFLLKEKEELQMRVIFTRLYLSNFYSSKTLKHFMNF